MNVSDLEKKVASLGSIIQSSATQHNNLVAMSALLQRIVAHANQGVEVVEAIFNAISEIEASVKPATASAPAPVSVAPVTSASEAVAPEAASSEPAVQPSSN